MDRDAEVDGGPVDGEDSRVLAQWPELPALEGKVGVSVLHQHKGVEGVHTEGDFGLRLLVTHVGDAVHPPLLPWIERPLYTLLVFRYREYRIACPTRSIPASHLGSFQEDNGVGQHHRHPNRRAGFAFSRVGRLHGVGEHLESVVQHLEKSVV